MSRISITRPGMAQPALGQSVEGRLMQKSQHTPGPWSVQGPTPASHGPEWEVSTDNGHGIWTARAQSEADARLIAVAPDLLAALNQIANEMQVASSRGRAVPVEWLDLRIATARAALQSVEGR